MNCIRVFYAHACMCVHKNTHDRLCDYIRIKMRTYINIRARDQKCTEDIKKRNYADGESNTTLWL